MRRGQAVRTAVVYTHRRPQDTSAALKRLCDVARARDIELRFSPEETRKHGIASEAGFRTDAEPSADGVDLCLVLGGDGSILSGLREFAGTGVPVFGVNFGEVGFLATLEPDEADDGLARAFDGDFEVLDLPAIDLQGGWKAINDISIHRKPGLRVADLSYAVGDLEVGRVRCDGLVVATPAGSTGYNLANGGPVMAWGVEGFVVSFIAPHSLTARALVVAPDDAMRICNESPEEPVDVTVDGRPVCELAPGEAMEARFAHAVASLAQLPGSTFYHRLRQKFGRFDSQG